MEVKTPLFTTLPYVTPLLRLEILKLKYGLNPLLNMCGGD